MDPMHQPGPRPRAGRIEVHAERDKEYKAEGRASHPQPFGYVTHRTYAN